MKTLLDVPGRSRRSATQLRSTVGEEATTVPANLVDGLAVEPAGRLVAGRYRLRSLLGCGGMGRVWLAQDEVLNRLVAVKQFNLSDRASDITRKEARIQALNEARAAARVDHVGAIKIHDVVKDEGCPWIVMELLSGRTLAAALDAEGPLPMDQVTNIGLSLLDVLQATHRAGIVHRDVKPANVHLCDGGRVVLMDFGIARTIDDGCTVSSGLLVGSPAYISPEQFRCGEVGRESDLFSLGATLFAAVEGSAPFDKGDLFATLTAVVVDAPGPFRRAGLLRPIIEGLLVKEPDQRLSADQAHAALRALQRAHSMQEAGYRGFAGPAERSTFEISVGCSMPDTTG
jgi:serine/threonine protein kinase